MSARRKLTLEELKTFALGGKAFLTVENAQRGTHVTFLIQQAKEKPGYDSRPYFVKGFTGTDNQDSQHYTYLGALWTTERDGTPCAPRYSAKRRDDERPVAKAAAWLARVLAGRTTPPEHVSFWQESRCCFCGKKLTTPESFEYGYGPVCAAKNNLPWSARSERASNKTEEVLVASVVDADGRAFELETLED